MNSYNVFFRIIALSLISLYLLLSVIGCSNKQSSKWTILIYMGADNNLSDQAVENIIQMEQANFPSSINIIVQLDPNQYSDDPQAKRYKIHRNKSTYLTSPVVEYLGEIDSGSYLSLADFVNWGIDKYPADRLALVIWAHGSGWTRNEAQWISPDGQSINQMSVANGDLRAAFRLFKKRLDIVMFDACYMQTIEVITEIAPYSNYIIGSENIVPFEGFPYREIFQEWTATAKTETISKHIAQLYITSHSINGSQNPNNFERKTTCSVVDTSQLNPFLSNLKDFCANYSHIASTNSSKIARNNTFPFNYQESDVDLKEYFYELSDNSQNQEFIGTINELLEDIDRLFVYQGSENLPANVGTASIWYPIYPEYYSGSNELYSKLKFANTNWLSFLANSFESKDIE